MVSPLKLLKNTLDPTRGINSTIYSFFELDLGIFDLAGQEKANYISHIAIQIDGSFGPFCNKFITA